jgi:hypothetical protein
VIQQFQPKYNPPLNMESESAKSVNTSNQLNVVPEALHTVVQMPYTVVTKMTPTEMDDDIYIDNDDQI